MKKKGHGRSNGPKGRKENGKELGRPSLNKEGKNGQKLKPKSGKRKKKRKGKIEKKKKKGKKREKKEGNIFPNLKSYLLSSHVVSTPQPQASHFLQNSSSYRRSHATIHPTKAPSFIAAYLTFSLSHPYPHEPPTFYPFLKVFFCHF